MLHMLTCCTHSLTTQKTTDQLIKKYKKNTWCNTRGSFSMIALKKKPMYLFVCFSGVCFIVANPKHACLCQRRDPWSFPLQRRKVCIPPYTGCWTWLVHNEGKVLSVQAFLPSLAVNCSVCFPCDSDLQCERLLLSRQKFIFCNFFFLIF